MQALNKGCKDSFKDHKSPWTGRPCPAVRHLMTRKCLICNQDVKVSRGGKLVTHYTLWTGKKCEGSGDQVMSTDICAGCDRKPYPHHSELEDRECQAKIRADRHERARLGLPDSDPPPPPLHGPYSGPSNRPLRDCPLCRKTYPVTIHGAMRVHQDSDGKSCAGSRVILLSKSICQVCQGMPETDHTRDQDETCAPLRPNYQPEQE